MYWNYLWCIEKNVELILVGTLYIISTPIGNLGDITYRALDILKTIDFLGCEDTRVTKKLLNHYKISSNLFSYNDINEKPMVQYFQESAKKVFY